MKNLIAIVVGEPNSINSEIIVKAWKKISKKQKKNIFLIGSAELLNKQFDKLKIYVPLTKIDKFSEIKSGKQLQILDVKIKFNNPFKVSSSQSSKYVLKCLNLAHNLSYNKKIYGFINCPIDKFNTFKSKKIGVTEYLSKKNKLLNSEIMMIYNKKFAVVPITTHIKVKNISKILNKQLIKKKILNLNISYKKIFKKNPFIGVLGLNPHNDELRHNSEEEKIIKPLIKYFKKKGFNIVGPIPSDTAFIKQKKDKYDVLVGMYHDQVLQTFKTLFEYDAINMTLGLKYLRLSPDHGTAKDIICLGKANPISLISCINFIYKQLND
tara:strand:- start:275 stop:1246 length:972 start_codon:yes stop_codon:yes gene_type:complete